MDSPPSHVSRVECRAEPSGDRCRGLDLALVSALLGVHALLLALLGTGYMASDDMAYARIAHELATGTFELEPSTFHHRFLVTVPLAAIYQAVGVTGWSTLLWPVLCSLGSLAIVYALALASFGRVAALCAGVLFLASTAQIRYATNLRPDPVLSFFMLATLLVLVRARRPGVDGARALAWAALAAAGVALAVLAKESIVWMFPFLIGLAALDLAKRQNVRFWVAFAAFGAAAGAAFFGAYAAFAGDPFARIAALEYHNESLYSFRGRGVPAYLRRLTYEPAAFLLGDKGYGVSLALALPVAIGCVAARATDLRPARLFAAYLAVLTGAFWFGSTSLSEYNPLPVDGRLMLPLLAPLCLLAGACLSLLARESPSARGLGPAAGALLAVAALGWLGEDPRYTLWYLVLAAAVALAAAPGRSSEGGRSGSAARGRAASSGTR